MLPLKNRLSKKKDFDRVFKKGKSSFDDLLGVKTIKGGKQGFPRFGIMVSSKISKKAVTRNKIKRRIRNIVAKNYIDNINAKDVIIITLPGILNKKYNEIEKSLCAHFKKLKI
ncbi:ribonuclease P protein component [Candidatus Parcubacteria bacterium]|nr:ribonuclease P protein component [Candidatus Parcubacteria bacterium]